MKLSTIHITCPQKILAAEAVKKRGMCSALYGREGIIVKCPASTSPILSRLTIGLMHLQVLM